MTDLWWTLPAFLLGWVIGGNISDWVNRELIKAQREYIAMLRGESHDRDA